ncbi:hypothetical protein HF086_010809 [Spodoptera exigua]|uniref:THAP domain-containing protein 9 n=1 Tax=Spodoptera exigua TaxID=7107 RepID=A0A922SCG7_SPOEX|nr:hypothetical protein HF086_010809 [Spodoptera exigua]
MHGYVDICNKGTSGDYLAEAKEALVFLVTAINGAFKIPVGYFLVAGVTGEQRSNLVRQCLELLDETGIEVTSLTFDGCPANISMAKELGCSFNPHNIKSHFSHPITNRPIFVFPDPCHMLKLLRNAFEAYGIIIDNLGRQINWCLLKELNEVQEKEKLHLANKLRRGHIFFKNQKMKVRLASQLFSESVADALIFCAKHNMPKFKAVDGTVDFLKIINNLFDTLNSRSMAQIKFKKPLFPGNKLQTFEFLDRTETYIKSLQLPDGSTIMQSSRKTGFIGFLICIKSLKDMYIRLIEQEKRLQYLPTYKISQDHIELMFGQIRAHGGCNTNPTARQFQAIYKKILVKSELRDVDMGNCTSLEEISYLTCSSAVQHINVTIEPRFIHETQYDDNIDELYEQAQFDEEISMLVQDLSQFSLQAISYIAGFVVHALIKIIKCETCIGALLAEKYEESHHFIKFKDKGGLMYPSPDVIMICKRMEIIIKTTYLTDNKLTVKTKNIKQELMAKALPHFIGLDLFDNIKFHQFDQSPLNNHIILLIKAIMEKYINLRLHYLTKSANPTLSKRQVLHKYLHFTGQ